MDTPKDAYEEAIEKMAKAAWDYGERENRTPEAWDDLEDVWHKTYREEARAAAEAIGLRDMIEVVEDVTNGAGNVSNATIAKAGRVLNVLAQ
jgi:hypothetical protein